MYARILALLLFIASVQGVTAQAPIQLNIRWDGVSALVTWQNTPPGTYVQYVSRHGGIYLEGSEFPNGAFQLGYGDQAYAPHGGAYVRVVNGETEYARATLPWLQTYMPTVAQPQTTFQAVQGTIVEITQTPELAARTPLPGRPYLGVSWRQVGVLSINWNTADGRGCITIDNVFLDNYYCDVSNWIMVGNGGVPVDDLRMGQMVRLYGEGQVLLVEAPIPPYTTVYLPSVAVE